MATLHPALLCCFIGVGIIFPPAARACEGQDGKLIFEDKFSDDAGGWLFDGNTFTLTGSSATITPNRGSAAGVLNRTFNVTEGDFCVEASFTPDAVRSNAGFGVIFWAKSENDSWAAVEYSNGMVVLARYLNGKWSTVWRLLTSSIVKIGTTDIDNMRVVAKNDVITVIVNGDTVKSVRAKQPAEDDDHYFGIFAGTSKPTGSQWSIKIHSFTAIE